MLLQLHPPHPHPVIQLPFGFKDPDHGLPNPHAWTAQLSNLMHDELDTPKTIHSLDKSVGITSLLEQVTFDLPSLTVSCRFVDGAIEEWPIITPGHVKCLRDIMSDVEQATAEDDRHRERLMEKEKERDVVRQRPPPSSVRVRSHKKQRSLFMSIVSAVGYVRVILAELSELTITLADLLLTLRRPECLPLPHLARRPVNVLPLLVGFFDTGLGHSSLTHIDDMC